MKVYSIVVLGAGFNEFTRGLMRSREVVVPLDVMVLGVYWRGYRGGPVDRRCFGVEMI